MKYFILFIIVLSGLMMSKTGRAQFFDKLVDHVTDKVENKVINDAGDAATKGVDKSEKAAGKAVKGDGKKRKNRPPSNAKTNTASEKQKVSGDGSGGKVSGKKQNVSNKAVNINTNYDFKPGDHTIFEIDFTKEQLGNFPRRLKFMKGNLAVIERNGERFGRVKGKTQFAIQLPEKLPKKFTIQLKLHDTYWLGEVNLTTTKKVGKGETYFALYDRHGVGVITKDGPSSTGSHKAIEKGVVPIEIMVDGKYAKMYVDRKRVANIPQVNIKRTDMLYFSFRVDDDDPKGFGYITDIRIAGGGRSLYQQLESDGRIAINDIHFATGKATILPESSASIEKIAKLLRDHSSLKILIEGHTDNVGDFDANMKLSKDRAAAVKSYLIEKKGIAADRMNTMGAGESRPVADNDTEEGRAQNRRVEIVKM